MCKDPKISSQITTINIPTLRSVFQVSNQHRQITHDDSFDFKIYVIHKIQLFSIRNDETGRKVVYRLAASYRGKVNGKWHGTGGMSRLRADEWQLQFAVG